MKRCGWFLMLFLLAGLSHASRTSGEEKKNAVDYSAITLDSKTFNPAARCGECHIDIHAFWTTSMHARAFTDPAFQATFQDPRIQRDEAIKRRCLQCHAPAAYYDRKLGLKSGGAGREGVTCDFCHSVQAVDLQNEAQPFVVAPGKLKRGPLKDTKSPVHETQHSTIFASGELCGGCHNMTNLKGLPIITTYSEWKEHEEGKASRTGCGECHMPLAPGATVSSTHQKTMRRINLHSFPGGRSRAQLFDALEVSLAEASRTYGKMNVKLALTNTGSGHYMPTGNPLRKVIVEFKAYRATNQLLYQHRVELSKSFADAQGKPMVTDLDILLDATQVTQDSRIPPGGTRVLEFEFPAPDERLLVEARVLYSYRNEAFPKLARQEELITFRKVVNKR
jgi:hypothetical protein